MRLYNQLNKPLRWDMGGKTYTAAPFGQVEPEVPDELVAACESRTLPLKLSSVAPEHKAQITVKAEADAARSDELRSLREDLTAAAAQLKSARSEAERSQKDVTARDEKIVELRAEITQLTDKLTTAQADTLAAEKLLQEMSRKVVDLTDQGVKAAVSARVAAAEATPEAPKAPEAAAAPTSKGEPQKSGK